MNELDDGGPAFPCGLTNSPMGDITASPEYGYPGMTLRDWFAGMAMQGLCATNNTEWNAASRAQSAYLLADAMIYQRSAHEKYEPE